MRRWTGVVNITLISPLLKNEINTFTFTADLPILGKPFYQCRENIVNEKRKTS